MVQETDVQAWARGVQSLVCYYAGDFRQALAYARDGAQRAPRGKHRVRLAVNGEARALARLGNRDGVDEAVERAFLLLEELPPPEQVSASLTLDVYCPARAAGNAATAYLSIGAPDRVPAYLNLALSTFDGAGLRGPQALSRLDLATALLRGAKPEVERACELATEALTLTTGHRYESVTQRARQFLAATDAWATTPPVREVAQAILDRARPSLAAGPA
jgi:hypothetical protein